MDAPPPLTDADRALLDVALRLYALLERGLATKARTTHARADHHTEATQAEALRLRLRQDTKETP